MPARRRDPLARDLPAELQVAATDGSILTDSRLLTERLRASHPGIQVLFISGYADDAVVRHGILHDQVNLLQKPFAPPALARKVREVLDRGTLAELE